VVACGVCDMRACLSVILKLRFGTIGRRIEARRNETGACLPNEMGQVDVLMHFSTL